MATTYEPMGRDEFGRPIFEAVCEVCGKRCWAWAAPTIEVPGREVLADKVGALAYCDDHATPPPPAPEPVPESITPAQLLIAARRVLGIQREDLEAMIEGVIARIAQSDIEASRDARDKWDRATVIERTHPLIAIVAQRFGKSDDEVDEMFRVGATL